VVVSFLFIPFVYSFSFSKIKHIKQSFFSFFLLSNFKNKNNKNENNKNF